MQKSVPGSDHVTGLCSRGELEALLASRLSAGPTRPADAIAIVICDVVGLKRVNDAEGFHAGDAVLASAAGELKLAAPDATMLARLGGDEFVAVYGGPDADRRAAAVADRLLAAQRNRPESQSVIPQLRTAWATAEPCENSAELIDRLYARMRAS